MRFEVAERIETNCSRGDVLRLSLEQFEKVAGKVEPIDRSSFIARSIEATFGSINRSDETTVTAKEIEDGWLLTAEVSYRPSVAFWIFLILALFTYIGWIIPIIFYLLQKSTVRDAVSVCLKRVGDELKTSTHRSASKTQTSALDDLEKLAGLKERGFITEEEFSEKKSQLLRRAA